MKRARWACPRSWPVGGSATCPVTWWPLGPGPGSCQEPAPGFLLARCIQGSGGERGIPRQVGGGSPLAWSEGKFTEQVRCEPASTLLGWERGRRTSAPTVGARGGVGRLCSPGWQVRAWGCVPGAAALLRPEDSPSGGQGPVGGVPSVESEPTPASHGRRTDSHHRETGHF